MNEQINDGHDGKDGKPGANGRDGRDGRECPELNPHCEVRFSSLETGDKKILENQLHTKEKIDDMFNRLFKDNGRKSYQTRLEKVEDFMHVHLWINGVAIVAIISAVIAWLFKKL